MVFGAIEHRLIGCFRYGRRRWKIFVASDRFTAGRADTVENAFLCLRFEKLQCDVRHVDLDATIDDAHSIGDRTHRGEKQPVVGLIRGGERRAITEISVDSQQDDQWNQEPAQQLAQQTRRSRR